MRPILFWLMVAYWLVAVGLECIAHPTSARKIFSNEEEFNI